MEAVFTDGISTAAYVSELSGRGIGMAAVRAECQARGGRIAATNHSRLRDSRRVQLSGCFDGRGSHLALRRVARGRPG